MGTRGSARAVPTSTTSRWVRCSTGRRRRRCRPGWPPRTRRSSVTGCGWPWTLPVYRGDRLPGPLAHPGLVCDVAIGQSTLVTQRVKANLFYRGLTFHRFPVIGDSIYTRTEVVGLRANSVKPGRAPTGLAALRMITIDQADRLGARLLPLRHAARQPQVRSATGRPTMTCPASAPTRRRRPRIRSRTGTARRSARGCPARISIRAWRVLCCTAPATSSAARRSWPA